MFRIGHTRGISYRRHQTRWPLPVSLEGLTSSEPPPESEATARTLWAELLEAIRALPHGRRQVLLLHLEGLAPREIGEVLIIATADGAKAAGVFEDRGTIEVGKRVDLVLLTQDPRTDIRAGCRTACSGPRARNRSTSATEARI